MIELTNNELLDLYYFLETSADVPVSVKINDIDRLKQLVQGSKVRRKIAQYLKDNGFDVVVRG